MIPFDLNNPNFQVTLLEPEKEDVLAFFSALRKLARMDWDQIYRDKGLHWERIDSSTGPGGVRVSSIRISRRFRAVVHRRGDTLVFLSLHPDHDSAYSK